MMPSRLRRIAPCALLALTLSLAPEASGQSGSRGGFGGGGGSGSRSLDGPGNVGVPSGPQGSQAKRSFSGRSISDDPLAAVDVEGNTTIPDHAILSRVLSQAGRAPFDEQIKDDVRALYETHWFSSVEPVIRNTSAGLVLVFRVRERPIVGRVEFRGNDKVKTNALLAECGLESGSSPYNVDINRQCVRRLKSLYVRKGYRNAQVSLVSGDRPDQRDVIFQINEGPKVVVDGFQFVGNKAVRSSILKTQLETKRQYVWLIGGIYDPESLDGDVQALKQYYRNIGYMDAEVTAKPVPNRDGSRITVQYRVSEGTLYKVRSVRFEGNGAVFSDGELANGLKLKKGSRFLARELREDVEDLKNRYDELGRPFARIEPRPVFNEKPGVLDLVYDIDEDTVRYIGRVNIHIRGDDPHTRETVVRNIVSRYVTPGELARAKDLRQARARLENNQLFERQDPVRFDIRPVDGTEYLSPALRTRGQSPDETTSTQQPHAHDQQAHRRPDPLEGHSLLPAWSRGPAGLPLPHAPGASRDLSRSTDTILNFLRMPEMGDFNVPREEDFADYTFRGQSPVDDLVNTGRPAVNPEAVFRGQSIDRFGQPNPQNFIDGGSPQGDPFGGALNAPPGFVDVDIDVTEARTGRFMFGAGVNSDAGVVGQIVLEENNFDLFRPPRSFSDFVNGKAFRGGGQRFRLEAVPGSQVSRYLLSWSDPYFLNTDFNLGVSGFFFSRFFDDWNEERLGGRVTLGRLLDQNWSVSSAIRLERVNIQDVAAGAPAIITDVAGDNFLSTGRVALAYDTRDSSFAPSTGFFAEGGYEQAFGDFNYPKFDLTAQRYWTLYRRPDGLGKHILQLRGQFGYTGDDTPVFERYFAGGFQTFRGFSFRGVSPIDSGARIGGQFLTLGTLEYLFPITADDNIKGVVFSDFGTVENDVSLDNFRATVGVGLRLSLPAIGPAPLAFDFAIPLASEDFDDERVFSFYVGLTR